jgi:hypothetical protein
MMAFDPLNILIETSKKSQKILIKRISNVRWGKEGEILFEYINKDGVKATYSAPEPMDIVPAFDTKGTNNEASRAWALRQILDKKVKLKKVI